MLCGNVGDGGGGIAAATVGSDAAWRRASSSRRLSSPRAIAQWWFLEKIGFITTENRLRTPFSATTVQSYVTAVSGPSGASAVRSGDQRPDPDPDEVALGLQAEAARRVGLGHRELPAQGVRQPALRPQADDLADARLVAGLELADAQVDRRPPARQPGRVAQDRR